MSACKSIICCRPSCLAAGAFALLAPFSGLFAEQNQESSRSSEASQKAEPHTCSSHLIEGSHGAAASQNKYNPANAIDRELRKYFDSLPLLKKGAARAGERDSIAFPNQRNVVIAVHRVARGESLWTIAKKYKKSPKLLLAYNSHLRRRPIYVGDRILLGSIGNHAKKKKPKAKQASLHRVVKGDTLYSLARRYKLSVKHLQKSNGLGSATLLSVGSVLKIIPKSYAPKPYAAFGKAKRVQRKKAFILPLRGKLTSGYGRRIDPLSGKRLSYHKGIDIAAPAGTPFYASKAGTVIRSQYLRGYGNCIFLSHKDDYISVYAHNQKNLVKKGEFVHQGKKIGLVGRTGAATGAHLHFEVRKMQRAINPLYALRLPAKP